MEKTFTQEEVDKLIKEKSQASFKKGLEKGSNDFKDNEEISKLLEEKQSLISKVYELETLPKQKELFIKNGGKKEAFNDFIKVNKEFNEETIKQTKEQSKWAFNEETSNQDTINNGGVSSKDEGSLLA